MDFVLKADNNDASKSISQMKLCLLKHMKLETQSN